MDFGNLFAGRW